MKKNTKILLGLVALGGVIYLMRKPKATSTEPATEEETGTGGGGNGVTATDTVGAAGTDNTGGGGGSSRGHAVGAAGGKGIVIIRYAGSQVATGGTVTTSPGYTIHTFTGDGTFAISNTFNAYSIN